MGAFERTLGMFPEVHIALFPEQGSLETRAEGGR